MRYLFYPSNPYEMQFCLAEDGFIVGYNDSDNLIRVRDEKIGEKILSD